GTVPRLHQGAELSPDVTVPRGSPGRSHDWSAAGQAHAFRIAGTAGDRATGFDIGQAGGISRFARSGAQNRLPAGESGIVPFGNGVAAVGAFHRSGPWFRG